VVFASDSLAVAPALGRLLADLELVNAYSQPLYRPIDHAIVARLRFKSVCEWIAASSDLFHEGLELHRQRADKEWSLTDCISFVVMQRRGITRSLTHDHHFEQAGFEALLRRDPP
jgi:predicted nucleic acid-binding protein